MKTMMITLGLIALLGIVAYLLVRKADGPSGPLMGGKLVSGEWVAEAPTDWDTETDGRISNQQSPYFIEMELEGTGTSRTTGIMLYEGELYIPCDLGFGWSRMSGTERYILNFLYLVKGWHHDAAKDGRVVLRMDGKRYPLQAVRIIDPERIEALKTHMESMVAVWMGGKPWGPRPTEGPSDIWFFRLDPRHAPS